MVIGLHFRRFIRDNSLDFLSCHVYIVQDLGQPLALNACPFDSILMLVVALESTVGQDAIIMGL